jgi:hypothetical protein
MTLLPFPLPLPLQYPPLPLQHPPPVLQKNQYHQGLT